MVISDAPLLIVEDHGLTRFALGRLLGQRGWTILTASSVAEGIHLLSTHPACIVVDLMLPDGSGEDVLRRVREAGLRSRVIVCTAVSDESRLEGLRSLRPDAVVRKPVDVGRLLEACSN